VDLFLHNISHFTSYVSVLHDVCFGFPEVAELVVVEPVAAEAAVVAVEEVVGKRNLTNLQGFNVRHT